MLRVLFVHPSFQPPGGGNSVAAWMLQALRGRYALSALTWSRIDVDEMNQFYGTSLRPDDVVVEHLPRWMTAMIDAVPSPAGSVRYALLLRRAARMAGRFDLLVSVNNEADFGRRGIQYIHYPLYQRPRPQTDHRGIHRVPGLLPLYYWSVDRLGGVSMDRIRQNLTLANSDWTGRLVHRLHGITARTLYPPVPAHFPDVPWEERCNGFVCVGRFAPEKNLERVIDIVAGVRAQVPDVTLCLAGTPGPPDYYRHIKDYARRAGEWVRFEVNLSRESLLALMPQFRYGIHGMTAEHFGMGPAELAAAGCILFVPNDGGQVEIVNSDPRLVYGGVDDAVAAITRLMRDAVERTDVARMLRKRAEMFSVDRFVSTFQEIVDEAMSTGTAARCNSIRP